MQYFYQWPKSFIINDGHSIGIYFDVPDCDLSERIDIPQGKIVAIDWLGSVNSPGFLNVVYSVVLQAQIEEFFTFDLYLNETQFSDPVYVLIRSDEGFYYAWIRMLVAWYSWLDGIIGCKELIIFLFKRYPKTIALTFMIVAWLEFFWAILRVFGVL